MDTLNHEIKLFEIDYNKMFYLRALHFEYKGYDNMIKLLVINKHNMKLLNKFYIDEENKFAISEINIKQ